MEVNDYQTTLFLISTLPFSLDPSFPITPTHTQLPPPHSPTPTHTHATPTLPSPAPPHIHTNLKLITFFYYAQTNRCAKQSSKTEAYSGKAVKFPPKESVKSLNPVPPNERQLDYISGKNYFSYFRYVPPPPKPKVEKKGKRNKRPKGMRSKWQFWHTELNIYNCTAQAEEKE